MWKTGSTFLRVKVGDHKRSMLVAMNSSVINFFKNGGKTRSATKTFDTLLISGECRANFSLVFDAVLFFRTVILCVWL